MQIAVEQNNAYWLLKIGFDPAFGNCSPGNLLLAESLRDAARRGLASLEFLGTVEPWTQVWTDQERKCVALRYYPFNVRGGLTLLSETAATGVRRFADARRNRAAAKTDRRESAKASAADAPAGPSASLPTLAKRFVGPVKAPLHVLARHAARSYIAGDRLDDALAVAHRLAEQGIGATIGFWDSAANAPDAVFRAYESGLAGLAAAEFDAYLSIKLPSLGYSDTMLAALIERSIAAGVGLHCDALGPETVDRTWAALTANFPAGGELSCTLPARWQRSLADADWAVASGLAVRVVKGQWPDPSAPARDPRGLSGSDSSAGRSSAARGGGEP